MSFSDPRPPFMQPPQPFVGGGDIVGGGYWFPMNNEQFDPQSQFEQNPHPLKRPRNSEENQSNSTNSMPYQSMNMNLMNTRMQQQPPNAPLNPKGTGNIFFKTRFCAKFKQGMCRNGENCNFAHGNEDLRQPPPNWQELVGGATGCGRVEDRLPPPSGNWDDDQKIIHRLKLCKKFYKGEECPYGDRCNFIHEDPAKLSMDDPVRFRESSAISIGTTGGPAMVNGSGSNLSESSRFANVVGTDAFRKPTYWKTKLCTKWETTGHCPFGEKCHFAHGLAELQPPGARIEVEAGNTGSILARSQSVPLIGATPSVSASVPPVNGEGQRKKCLLKCDGSKKINRIYADWLDDLPLAHNLPNQVES